MNMNDEQYERFCEWWDFHAWDAQEEEAENE
jgi:hypothetical protein